MAEGDAYDYSGLFGPQYTNPELLNRAETRVSGALEAARQAREKARAEFGTNIDSTVKSIDDTVAQLRKAHDSQWNLPLLAFSAGMLHTTPGVASNFGNELGSGLAAAVPAINQTRMRDQDFWEKIAQLQAQRGSIASAPSKLDLAQSEKEIEDLTRSASQLEAAGIRGVPAQQRLTEMQHKNEAAIQAKRQDQLTKMTDAARTDVKEMLKNFEGAQPEDVDALTQMVLQDRINRYNAQPGQDVKLDVPPLTPEQIERANKIRTGLQKKGADENRAKLRANIVSRADAQIKAQYPAFSSLQPGEQEALRQDTIQKLIAENNKSQKPTDDSYLEPDVFSPGQWQSIQNAQSAHSRFMTLGSPTAEEVEASHLPTDMIPKTYSGLSYADRQKKMAREDESSKKTMQTLQSGAQDLAGRAKTAEEFLANYDASNRTGWTAGWTPAIGSEQAQTLDKLSAALNFTNVPQGQGSISDAERATLAKSNASRALQRGAVVNILNVYKEAAQRSNEQLQFFENWQNTFKTTDGAMAAWNEYISSPQGTILKVGKDGSIQSNPRRMSWREYFDRKNKGDLPAAPAERYERRNGKLVKVEE